jgi:hypothetical protein
MTSSRSDNEVRRAAREDDGLQLFAAEELAARAGISFVAAWDRLEMQDAAMEVADDVERALGAVSGAIWFDGGRVKVGIAGVSPSHPAVEGARRIWREQGLADKVDFVEVRWSLQELVAGEERAWTLLEPLARQTPIGGGIDPLTNSVVITTTDRLSEQQLATVRAAVQAARVDVRVEAQPPPDPDRGAKNAEELDSIVDTPRGSDDAREVTERKEAIYRERERMFRERFDLEPTSLVGMTTQAAHALTSARGVIIRVLSHDGLSWGQYSDLRANRVNVHIEDDIIVRVDSVY